jgi:hypothetical protein
MKSVRELAESLSGIYRNRCPVLLKYAAGLRNIRLQKDPRLRQQLRSTLAGPDQITQLTALLRAQPNHILLDGNLFPGHESPPALLQSDSDSEVPVMINDEGY